VLATDSEEESQERRNTDTAFARADAKTGGGEHTSSSAIVTQSLIRKSWRERRSTFRRYDDSTDMFL
jgi:hypothetical protein